MILYRFALVTFNTKREVPTDITLIFDEKTNFGVGGMTETAEKDTFILYAGLQLRHKPKRTKSGLVVIPRKIRSDMEEAIEIYCNVLSVSLNCSRSVRSGHPVLALRPEDQGDLEYLETSIGFYIKNQNCMSSKGDITFDISSNLQHLNDRMDGCSLLSEALSAHTATGKLHEYIRLYERAFGLGGHRLVSPMTNFLSGTIFGYSEPEIKGWIKLRDGVTHADKRNDIALEVDCVWKINRLEQAAYDILLNKADWRTVTTTRRNVWRPSGGTTNAEGDLFLTQGLDWRAEFITFDPFRRFIQHLKGNFDLSGSGLWIGPLKDEADHNGGSGQILVNRGRLMVVGKDDDSYFLRPASSVDDVT